LGIQSRRAAVQAAGGNELGTSLKCVPRAGGQARARQVVLVSAATAAEGPVLRDDPRERVARLRLNRPERRNAINPQLRAALREGIADALADPGVRAIVIAGAGGTFCSGGDLASAASGGDPAASRARMIENHRLVRLLWHAEKPLIAAVEGWAVGAGAGLALLCDTIVAGRSACFAFGFLRVGLVPDYGLSLTLPRRIGHARAADLLLGAGQVSAVDGAHTGLVDVVVADEVVEKAALDRASLLAQQPPMAFALAKRMLVASMSSLDATLEAEAAAQALCFLGTEHQEGKRAFLEKRAPSF
jgi:enoyl-CoA hydratase/carnithine racemase